MMVLVSNFKIFKQFLENIRNASYKLFEIISEISKTILLLTCSDSCEIKKQIKRVDQNLS